MLNAKRGEGKKDEKISMIENLRCERETHNVAQPKWSKREKFEEGGGENEENEKEK